jgi:hypothetical protein
MRLILTSENQTVWDLALQYMGSAEGVFDILALNAFLRLDIALAEGQEVFIPDTILNEEVVNYYDQYSIIPATGTGELLTLTDNDMVKITQDISYYLTNGATALPGVRIVNLKGDLTVQIDYSISPDPHVVIHVEQSLDGLQWSSINGSGYTLDPAKESHTYNIKGLLTDYVRVVIDQTGVGTINQITWRV